MKRRLSFPFRLRREISHPAVLIVVFVGFLPFMSKAQMQNLVPDSSFEDIKKTSLFFGLPLGGVGQQWFSPSSATPDLFAKPHKKDKYVFNKGNITSILFSPKNFTGFQYPHTGNIFAGLILYLHNDDFAEYIAIKLDSALIKGHTYRFKMYLSLAEKSSYVSNISCVFLTQTEVDKYRQEEQITSDSNKLTMGVEQLSLEPDITFNLLEFKDTANWAPFSDNYTANGGEQFLIIGPLGKQVAEKLPPIVKAFNQAYYYVDDVSLVHIGRNLNYVEPIIPVVAEKPYVIPNLYFETNKWDIIPKSFKSLDSIATHLKTLKGVRIEVSGHTDDVGTEEDNLKLSENRAKAVADYLISKGVNKTIVSATGYGEAVPVGTVKDRNRRVEIKLIR